MVFVDVSLPDEDGFAIAEQLARAGVALILTTGDHARRSEVERSGRAYVLKPFQLPALIRLLEQVMAGRCARRRRRVTH